MAEYQASAFYEAECMTKEPSCIFCGVVAGQVPSHVVWSDAEHVAFLDANPITAGHLLLIPRAHVPWVDELSAEAHARLFARTRALARSVASAAGAPRTGIAVEGYGVPHAHVHLVPVWRMRDRIAEPLSHPLPHVRASTT